MTEGEDLLTCDDDDRPMADVGAEEEEIADAGEGESAGAGADESADAGEDDFFTMRMLLSSP